MLPRLRANMDHRGVIDRSPDIPVLDLNSEGRGPNDVLNAILRGSLSQVAATMMGANNVQSAAARRELLDALIDYSRKLNP